LQSVRFVALPFAILISIDAATAAAAGYPERPVRMVVGFTPGSGGDALARMICTRLVERWGQPVVVENRSGASNTIAAALAARAAPDGYTLLMVNANHTITPSQMNLSYDPIGSFAPVSLLVTQPDVLVALNTLPVKSLKELIALARAKPGTLSFSSSGVGGAPYLAMALLIRKTGINMISVPYRGSAEALIALLGGEVHVMIGSISDVETRVQERKLNALAVSTKKRVPSIPDVPTVAEAADLPGYDVSAWQGVLAPAGTPKSIVNKLRDDMVSILRTPEIQAAMLNRGNVVIASTPEEFGNFIRDDILRWAPVVKTFDR